jgi:hypothetical protein
MSDYPTADFDSPWKDALNRYFPEFMAFYFPIAHQQINWTTPHVFLEQELQQIVRDSELGKRRLDCLVQISTYEAGEQWVYVHVEIQSQHDTDFAERLFTYNYRLYDRYRRPIATLAILADERPRWRPQEFSYSLFGCQMMLAFPTVKLLDYQPQLDSLLNDPNPFALVTAAHLLTQQTRQNPDARYDAKWRLARLLYERDWNKQRIIDLFAVIDWLMKLAPEPQQRLWQSIQTLERNLQMPYVTSVERFGIEKGLQQGLQKGEGLLLRRLLTQKFGPLPPDIEAKLTEASIAELEAWSDRLLAADSLGSIFEE